MTEIEKIIAIGLWAASEGEKPGSEWPETASESARRFWGGYAEEARAALDAAGFVVVPKASTTPMPAQGIKLTGHQMAGLRWISQQTGLVWGGNYDDPSEDVLSLVEFGLIERVKQKHHIGRLEFEGGYRITDAGRAMLKLAEGSKS